MVTPILVLCIDKNVHPLWSIHRALHNISLGLDGLQCRNKGLEKTFFGTTVVDMSGAFSAYVEDEDARWVARWGTRRWLVVIRVEL